MTSSRYMHLLTDLFDAADKGMLAQDELVTYGNSRLKLEEDREGLEYYGRLQLEKGKLVMLRESLGKLKESGMSLAQAAATIGRTPAELQSLW